MQHLAPKIKIIFQRQNVETADFSTLLQAFDPGIMTVEGLRLYADTLQIDFLGYGNENRLQYLIPEIRSFVRELGTVWPYAPYFCDLHTDFLAIDAASHVDHMRVLQRLGCAKFKLWIEAEELQRHVKQSLDVIQKLGTRAGLSTAQIRQRQRHYAKYIRMRLGPAK